MRKLVVTAVLMAPLMACGVDDTSPKPSNDSGTGHAGASGSSGSGGSTGGSAGSIGVMGGGGTGGTGLSGMGGTGGSAGTSGMGGGGTNMVDAAPDVSQGDGFDGYVPKPIVYCDGGATYSGMSLTLNGANSYGTFPRPVQGDFTMEAWIKTTTSMFGNQFWQGIPVFHADVQGGNNDFGASILNDHFAFGLGLGPGLNDVTVESTTAVAIGQWMHVTATRRQSTGEIQVLVNGIVEASQVLASQMNPLSASTTLLVGGNTIDGRYFSGEIDEVRIWNVVRTPAEIVSTMFKSLTGSEPGLVSYFKFDEASTTTAVDSSPSKVDLTLTGQAGRSASTAPICDSAAAVSDGGSEARAESGLDGGAESGVDAGPD
jgi:hypothetical protein